MADRPILFSAPMVRALLAGTKTQTRRTLNPQPYSADSVVSYDKTSGKWMSCEPSPVTGGTRQMDPWRRLRIAVGDRLYVREAWTGASSDAGPVICYRADFNRWQPDFTGPDEGRGPSFDYDRYATDYSRWAADLEAADKGWKPGIHMPRWASRLTLTVTDVRVERLRDISELDAKAEGVESIIRSDGTRIGVHVVIGEKVIGGWVEPRHRDIYETLWEHINGVGTWETNPWVAAYSFTVSLGNIDTLARAA